MTHTVLMHCSDVTVRELGFGRSIRDSYTMHSKDTYTMTHQSQPNVKGTMRFIVTPAARCVRRSGDEAVMCAIRTCMQTSLLRKTYAHKNPNTYGVV